MSRISFPSSIWNWLAIFGLVVAVVPIALVDGGFAILAAFALTTAWVILPSSFVFAIGQIIVVGLIWAAPPTWLIAVVELGLVFTLLEPLKRFQNSYWVAFGTSISFIGVLILFWLMQMQVESLLAIAVVFGGMTGILMYGGHRYLLVRLSRLESRSDS